MSKALLIHLTVIVLLGCATVFVWRYTEEAKAARTAIPADDAAEEFIQGRDGIFEEAKGMSLVAIPMILTALYAGFVTVVYLMPAAVDRFTQETFGSTEEMEADAMREARSAYAQGEYEEAVELFREEWEKDPTDRFPIVEMAKIQRDNLSDPAAAVETLRTALETNDWRQNDAAFFMFRIADIYAGDLDNQTGAVAVLQQVIEEFPETRHSANATHRLREMGEV